MKLCGFGLLDTFTELYEHNLFLFPDKNYASAILKRSIREEFVRGNVTKNWLDEHCYVYLGDFDSETGEFVKRDSSDAMVIPCNSAVYDLLENED